MIQTLSYEPVFRRPVLQIGAAKKRFVFPMSDQSFRLFSCLALFKPRFDGNYLGFVRDGDCYYHSLRKRNGLVERQG